MFITISTSESDKTGVMTSITIDKDHIDSLVCYQTHAFIHFKTMRTPIQIDIDAYKELAGHLDGSRYQASVSASTASYWTYNEEILVKAVEMWRESGYMHMPTKEQAEKALRLEDSTDAAN